MDQTTAKGDLPEKDDFKPYVAADKKIPELTVFSLILGVFLALIFLGANAYLGLRIGQTISSSIPSAVISMGIIRLVLRRESILENNMVQTVSSAGESIAGGMIFTIPAIFLWHIDGLVSYPSYLLITVIAVSGGVLGVMFVIPLRRAYIVEERDRLPYPEGTACAEVLLAGEEGGSKARITFLGFLVALSYKFLADYLKLFPSQVDLSLESFKGIGFGLEVLPALLGVGFIVGPRAGGALFFGGSLGWLVIMPLIYVLGTSHPDLFQPAGIDLSNVDSWGIWSGCVRYMGAGMVAFCGIYALAATVFNLKKNFGGRRGKRSEAGGGERTDRDVPLKIVWVAVALALVFLAFSPWVPVGVAGALMIGVFGFIFSIVVVRVVGVVGSSNSPVSGMAIATLLVTALIFKAAGVPYAAAVMATISIGAVICVVCAISGDIAQDLKTGHIVGATPYKQQIGEIVGAVAASFFVASVMTLLHKAWGFGSSELPAPQATLMKMVVEGVLGGGFPSSLALGGVALGMFFSLFRLPVLPIAVGLYLPVHLSAPLFIGGLLRWWIVWSESPESDWKTGFGDFAERGILFASGLVAGEGVAGIILAVLTVLEVNLALGDGPVLGNAASVLVFAFLAWLFLRIVKSRKKKGG
ncbi:MAG: oligopeptide transporter, OPT family [Deltaproteobacteria bacterium]|jgi:putative OPT family oligopeptide transporter|nr:oligopeptide transporter, OPT family [Deltaproteobacteria bacterium]